MPECAGMSLEPIRSARHFESARHCGRIAVAGISLEQPKEEEAWSVDYASCRGRRRCYTWE